MPGTYEIIAHPSDVGVEAAGSSAEEAFALAAEGMMSVIVDPASVEEREARTVSVEGADEERLLVRWLAEVLWLYDGGGFVPRRFTVGEISGNRLTASALGEPLDPAKHRLRADVKAVTYHGLAVRRAADGCTVRVYLDI
jgi:SHS2 domain-containing protein